MEESDEQFKRLVQLVQNHGPKEYELSEEIEEYHVLFESEENRSFNLILLSTSSDSWVEVDLFKNGQLITSETFKTENQLLGFVRDDLEHRLENL